MEKERSTVIVSIDSVEAYAEPQFVLEFDGKIYVTAAVIEYDPGDSDMDDRLLNVCDHSPPQRTKSQIPLDQST